MWLLLLGDGLRHWLLPQRTTEHCDRIKPVELFGDMAEAVGGHHAAFARGISLCTGCALRRMCRPKR